jgi:3-dehydroquinate synthase
MGNQEGMGDLRGDGDGAGPALRDIDQEVVVTFRYPVRFTHGLLDPRNPALREVVEAEDRARLLVVIDEGVADAHPAMTDDVVVYCAAHSDALELTAPPLVVPGGEAIKNRSGPVDEIRAAIDVHGVDRHSYVIVIGGGAVLDAVGYAAATAHRGVRLIRVPTTVLAQDDSGVGVKNGINAFGKKNFVGSFAPPHAVLNDFDLLVTLSERDWRAGISEAVKVALLKDAAFFRWIEYRAGDLDARSLPAMERLVHRSAELHLEHIATNGDPFELGSSRPLDFGHWAAHKLEQLSHHELRHGEAVSIGIALDSTYSYLTGSLPHADWRRIVEVFEAVQLPIWHHEMATPGSGGQPAVLAGLEEFREHLGGRLTIMLLERIGAGFEVHELDEAVLLEASDLLRRRVEGGDRGWQPTPAPVRSLSVS